MTAESSPVPDGSRRRGRTWLLLALVLVVAVILAGTYVVRGRRAAAAADCEKEPPKVSFAVAECDGGAPPAPGTSPPAPSPAKPASGGAR